ncbi:apolipoprotein N-acyltransferase [Marinicellulosiphila megalodicopiae]|uniref:apolipoprotein N-acyltransferase n=1 Tax=Marinicellulosiphila megalodicopiae TaxID=2724896 RepID=UPI003BAF5E33
MKLTTALYSTILPIISGALFSIGLAPFKLWPATFVSVAAWYILLSKFPQFSKRISYGYGFGFFATGISWIYFAFLTVYVPPFIAAASIFVFCLGFALLFLAQGWIYSRFFANKMLSFISFACLWMVFEWIRTWLFTGFPWLFAGYSMTDTYIGQLASLFGVYGLSFIVVLFAVLFSQILNVSHIKKASILFSFAVVFVLGYFTQFIQFNETTGSLKVAAIQSNVDQKTKWTNKITVESREQYLNETIKLNDTDLIVWPEAALTDSYQTNQQVLDYIGQWAKKNQTSLIAGVPRLVDNRPRNSIQAMGNSTGVYDKIHLVPFGEYMPYGDIIRKTFPFLNMNAYDYFPGDANQTPIIVNQLKNETWIPHVIGSIICYEAAYPELVRTNAKDKEIIITVSNDDWFGNSLAPHQHLQIAQMRAIENRLSVVRSTQSGITAFIDPYGKITHKLESFVSATLIGEVSLNRSMTVYSKYGHVYLMFLALLALVVIVFVRHKK